MQYFMATGAVSISLRCVSCGRKKPDKSGRWFIPKDDLRAHGIDPDALPIAPEGTPNEIRCLVSGCNQRGAEQHHWAPRHLFGDAADLWPRDYLCKQHHDEWHKRVTPNMCEVGK